MEKQKPEKKFRAGAISVAVWKNKTLGENGSLREFNSISFERHYKDKDGVWKTTHTFSTSDLPKAIVVLSKAYEYLTLKTQTVEV